MIWQLFGAIGGIVIPSAYVGYLVGHYVARREFWPLIRDLRAEVLLLTAQVAAARRGAPRRGRRAA